jgi:hypothetical protein
VLDELRDREAEVAFTERNELVEALRLDGEHEAFRDGVQVGASGGASTGLVWGTSPSIGDRIAAILDGHPSSFVHG